MERQERYKLKHDGLVDAVSDLGLHLQKYRKVYISLTALLVIVAVAIGAWFYHKSKAEEQAALLLSRARSAADLENIAANYEESSSAPLALIFLADLLYREGKFDEALVKYRLFLEKYPEQAMAPFAQIGLAYCQEGRGNWEEAIAQYRLVGQNFAQSSAVPEAVFNVARCQLQLGKREEAIAAYEEILNLHARSAFAPLAREQLVNLGISPQLPM